jgi:hypothetical protein
MAMAMAMAIRTTMAMEMIATMVRYLQYFFGGQIIHITPILNIIIEVNIGNLCHYSPHLLLIDNYLMVMTMLWISVQ